MNSTTVTVYSHFADCPEWRIGRYADGLSVEPTWTGEIEVQDLEDIFIILNGEGGYTREELGYTLPSLTAGDVIYTGTDYHLVASVGFKTITEEQYKAYRAMPYSEGSLWARRLARA